ncbi:GGDEF domain-containing protein [Colwellia sp. D2M02]|uniref:GGDEF domain-containing protein n=1 Tax=Colwellia sp. D2M02 TaxID=2841562 RepID=UPI001C0847D7|nr:GGDEF domain-containing protein [Colwellia sp. D2M02]MBU2893117.1 GGDEF domain-containing protein [Colwellia sp. D2M02]
MQLKSTLVNIIQRQQLTAFFQPIYATNANDVYGYEALIRGPSDSPLHNPQALFDAAFEFGLLSELELVCRRISIARFVALALKGKLFLNVSPMVFLQEDHPQGATLSYLAEHDLQPEQVVIELSEKYPIESPELLQRALMHYRDLGFQIAVDDLGAGYAGLKLWSEVNPNFVKIDRYFINQCHQDPIKREFIKSIISLGRSINAQVIAEGIETVEEFEQLQEFGMNLYQGFLFARPEPFPAVDLPAILRSYARAQNFPVHFEQMASSLLQFMQPRHGNELTKEVVEFLYKHPKVHSIPVIDNDKPIGMILRDNLLELFSTPFGRALNERKPISETMTKTPVIVEANTQLDEVAQLVTSEHDEKLLWHFIITDKGRYIGIGSVRDLLRQVTQQQLQHARYANPLSMLPGNVPIYQEVDSLIFQQKNFHFAYFDLNNFKPFNDIYGYAKGDQIIQLVAGLIKKYAPSQDFVGHIGGDDFVVIFKEDYQKENWKKSCEKIISEFDQHIEHFYDDAHLKAGGIEAKSRTGEWQFFSLLSLAIGVVSPDLHLCHSHHDIAELASDAKKQAKKLQGSAIFVCRRGSPSCCKVTEEVA